jgi:hypothetical protein
MQEVWLPVVGYEGLYEVSDQGRVRGLARMKKSKNGSQSLWPARVLKQFKRCPRYWSVRLSREGKAVNYNVHSLVAQAFLGEKPEGLIVLHGADGSLDNSLANLNYGSYKQNSLDKHRDGTYLCGERCHSSKLTESQVQEIRRQSAAGALQQSLAETFGIGQTAISAIIRRQTWAHL